MLYQLSYDHHEAMKCAIHVEKFHHDFEPPTGSGSARVAVYSRSVHNGFRGELGLLERYPEDNSHERNGKHFHA